MCSIAGHRRRAACTRAIDPQWYSTSPPLRRRTWRGKHTSFVHKLKICLKELNETRVWLLIVKDSEMLPALSLVEIIPECNELCRIISSSIKTARANAHIKN